LILYLDTSSLIKLYVLEQGSGGVRDLVARASLVATSFVAYPETRSALARLRREGSLAKPDHERVKRELEVDWLGMLSLPLLDAVWRQAGELAERHSLRGFDSIHLASYLSLRVRQEVTPVEFSSFDDRLNRAARLEARSG
jgi:predicted nucleic acid-binding protein